ncbi:hypothetical protein JNW98_29840 [Streptomyces sp. SCA2-4]|nr:hypothetical protein [Streptomyces huiliensis]
MAATCAAVAGLGPTASASGSQGAGATAHASKPSKPSKPGGPNEPGGPGKPAATARVTGSARLDFAYAPRDVIRFTVDARAVPFSRPLPGPHLEHGLPTDARGTVVWSHWVAATHETRRAEAAVDCLVTAGDTATFTATVTKSADPEDIGRRYGFSARTGGPGRGRFGFSWAVGNLDVVKGVPIEARVGTCMAPAPFAPLKSGGLTVRHADLPPLPAARERG